MSINLHYQFENTGATWSRTKMDSSTGKVKLDVTGRIKFSSDVEGSCFGYSLDWAHRIVQYNGDIQKSQPNKGIGTALQQRFEMKYRVASGGKLQRNATAVPFMVRTVSLSLVEAYQCQASKLAAKVDAEGSVVIFDNGLHWMAMAKINGMRFYFDSNDGLYSASTLSDYKKLVGLFVDDYKDETDYKSTWDVYSVAAG